MAQVNVNIAGRSYRMACADGEEGHLETLAAQVDARISALRESFGEIGDQRLVVMAAITIADELAECRRSIARMDEELVAARAHEVDEEQARTGWASAFVETLERAADRIERVAHELNGTGKS
jgi:cell division protein ZapA